MLQKEGALVVQDLTVGNPRKVLFMYALPLFGSNVFQQLYNVADTFVAGHFIGTDALAAVGNAFELILIYNCLSFGCSLAISVITAQYFGKKDITRMKGAVYTSLIAFGIIGLLVMTLMMTLAPSLLTAINTPAGIYADSLKYFNIYSMGFLFVVAYNLATGILNALGDSKTPFIFLVISSVSNVIVDILFVTKLNMGIAGTAWATFLCQGLSGIVSLALVLVRLKKLTSSDPAPIFSVPLLKELTAVALPSIAQQLFISIGNIMLQSVINVFGEDATGGFAAVMKLNVMAIISTNAFCNAMSNFAGQNSGAGKPRRIRQGVGSCIFLNCIVALAFTALYCLLAPVLVGLFITDGNQAAAEIGVTFLHIVSPFYLVLALKQVLDGVMRGVRKMSFFVFASLAEMFLRVALAYPLSAWFGLNGVWMAWPGAWIISLVVSVVLYKILDRKNFGITAVNEA